MYIRKFSHKLIHTLESAIYTVIISCCLYNKYLEEKQNCKCLSQRTHKKGRRGSLEVLAFSFNLPVKDYIGNLIKIAVDST